MYFPFQNQACNHMENINFERTLCHYVILQILQDLIWTLFVIAFAIFSC